MQSKAATLRSMKIFAIYSSIHLTQKPDWLEPFYAKHNSSPAYHVTLKQSCFLEESDIKDVKDKLSTFFRSFVVPEHAITLTFDHLVMNAEIDSQNTIMLQAEHNPVIHQLQQGILSTLEAYKDYVYQESKEWEENFNPHITLAADLSPTEYTSAQKELGPDHLCKGVIHDVALIIVDKMTPIEADKPENQTIYPI